MMTSETRKMVEQNATQVDLQREAVRDGMSTLLTDGLGKAMMGQTTIDEVEKLMATIEVGVKPGMAA
jgi:type II secretory ATPase GspE/PulE/Tfp pilus assembly ATPase PilB-like protein